MTTGWVKSLYCKFNALHDVYQPCAASLQAFKDVVLLFPKPPQKPKRHRPKAGSKPTNNPPPPPPPPQVAALTELPASHSSRRVVEIIFISSWFPPFPGEIDMLFRVHNPPRTTALFEEYRSAVRSRSGGDARCAADGNEMMRFHCNSGGGGDVVFDAGVSCCAVEGAGRVVVEAVRTFAGSGGAHESAGGGSGRRAMLVCRVIVGRVRSGHGPGSEGESVCSGSGELLVFDKRAVLPCFLIIYKV